MEQLILKYIQNNLSKDEIIALQTWLDKDPLNRQLFENITGQWYLSEDDIETSKQRVLRKIMDKHPEKRLLSDKHSGTWWSIARAAIFIIIGLCTFLIVWKSTLLQSEGPENVHNEIFIEKEANLGQKITFELPDGSKVSLNSGGKITYPKNFSSTSRNVTLCGEAFFEVTRDETKPFRIYSKEVRVQVLGTSFNVHAYPDEETVQVAVKSGKVSVHSVSTGEDVILDKTEMAEFSPDTKQLIKKDITDYQFAFGWVNQNLVFRDQNIKQIFKVLSRWYNVEFIINKKLSDRKDFNGSYKNPTLGKVLESLSFAYGFEFQKEGKKIIIK